jgi:methionyl-tRNA formyltransferase
VRELRAVAPEAMVVAAYGLILPQAVLDIPARGCLNIHASLLPRWRGAAPIHRALLAGDAATGISIMQMDAGLDTGAVLLAKRLPIDPRDTTGTLGAKLAFLGGTAIVEALARLDGLVPQPQDPGAVTYAAKVGKAETAIDWSRPAQEIDRQVRAFNPSPGAEGVIGEARLKIWEAEPVEDSALDPGVAAQQSSGLVVGCGKGALRLHVVQRPGGRRMSSSEFLRGQPLTRAPH